MPSLAHGPLLMSDTPNPSLTWAIRAEALTLALNACWTREQLIPLLLDHRTNKTRDAARAYSLDEWKRIENLIGDAMERCAVSASDLAQGNTDP